jgi:hypothetical protein
MKSALNTSRRVVTTCAAIVLLGCGTSNDGTGETGTGGQTTPPGSGGSTSKGGSGGANPSGGTVNSGGSVGAGGFVGTGGSSAAGTGGASGTGGRSGTGGMIGTGGSANNGGTLGTGGAAATGGRTGSGGGSGTGGAIGTGGVSGTGGAVIGGRTGTGGRATGGTTGGGTGGAIGTGGTTGAGGTGACPHVQMKGSDFCTIGDSWIQMPGNQVTTLENHLVTAGVIPSGEHFDRREVSGSTLDAIIKTYTNKPSNCKILVMDGGGIDLFSTALGPESSAVTAVVTKFKNFLAQVKTLGYTQHIIYSLYPIIPSTKNLNANMGPGYSAACTASAVDCHLVDLEPLFKGQHFASDSTHADNAGGVIIGDAWWKAMQENCIAQ